VSVSKVEVFNLLFFMKWSLVPLALQTAVTLTSLTGFKDPDIDCGVLPSDVDGAHSGY
jgi:hypothetical protein